MKRISSIVVLLGILAVGIAGQGAEKLNSGLLKASLGKVPLCFTENRGVFPEAVAYSIQGEDKSLFFTKNGITYRLKGKDRAWVVKLRFVGLTRAATEIPSTGSISNPTTGSSQLVDRTLTDSVNRSHIGLTAAPAMT